MIITSYSEIDDETKLKVLISWKGRVVMEKSGKYRNDEDLNKIYSTFCNVVHANYSKISTFKLRMLLIKVLNIDKPFTEKVMNYVNNLFDDTFGIPDEDRIKIVKSWVLRAKLEKNKKYFFGNQIKSVYEHLSNVLHGELEKHSLIYINNCEKRVDEFFIKLRDINFYQLQNRQSVLDFKKADRFKNKKIIKGKNNIKNSKIFFYKSPFRGIRIAFIESDPDRIQELISNKRIILKYKVSDIGVFEYVDSSPYESFINSKSYKVKNHYQIYYK